MSTKACLGVHDRNKRSLKLRLIEFESEVGGGSDLESDLLMDLFDRNSTIRWRSWRSAMPARSPMGVWLFMTQT